MDYQANKIGSELEQLGWTFIEKGQPSGSDIFNYWEYWIFSKHHKKLCLTYIIDSDYSGPPKKEHVYAVDASLEDQGMNDTNIRQLYIGRGWEKDLGTFLIEITRATN